MDVSRRGFLRLSVAAAGGTALGGLIGSGVNLGPDMVRDKPDDPLAIDSGHPASRIGDPGSKAVDPKAAVGIEHDLDHRGVLKPGRDLGPKRRAQHARAT